MSTRSSNESCASQPDPSEEMKLALDVLVLWGEEGLTADDWYALRFDADPALALHAEVDSFRVTISQLRTAGRVMDSGRQEWNARHSAKQNVWVEGDDTAVIRAQRIKKLRKLADELGFDVVER